MVPKYPVVLASASPRRKELLSELFDDFETVPAAISEDGQFDPLELARQKARTVGEHHKGSLVIGCDTIVFCHGKALGKPGTAFEAEQMLTKLSGRKHSVVTGVFLVWPGGEAMFAESTVVHFRDLSPEEIREYVETGEPMDKAGAYAIQGGASPFVTEIDGYYENVVGLPTQRLAYVLTSLELVES